MTSPDQCQFTRAGSSLVCAQCGRIVSPVPRSPVRALCRRINAALVGSWLAWLLKKLAGVDELPGCTCRSKARQMNLWGVAGCWPRVGLIVSWLQEEAEKRNLRFWAAGARCLVYAAILLAAVEWAFRPRPAGNKR